MHLVLTDVGANSERVGNFKLFHMEISE